ncbi:hypothetical protein [Streptomyces rubellomurinus]|uniref:hypothetical protein n=1 Tax=Streptomyces rubellomurinus (strain ATCC 31215) TaxID=359131 RepID=UPI000697B53C|nr:hypothetical protein [Streptomyces rubellomurinus]
MSTNRPRRIDRDTAEQLLGGAVGGPSAGQGASLTGPDGGPGQLARVLAAAAAPATAGELAGEEAALAAFREARLAPHPVTTTAPVRRRPMATATLARAFSTKAAAAVLGATALCGVAVAAGTGNLPGIGGGTPEPARTLGRDGASAAGSASSPTGGSAHGASARPPGTSPSAGAPALVPTPGSPSADGHGAGHPAAGPLADLCRGFVERTGKGEHPLRVAADPLFAQLVTEAGGADKVAEYCAKAPDRAGQDGHQGATGQPHDPGRTGSGSGSGSGAGKGGDGQGAQNGGNANGGNQNGGNANGGNQNGGADSKPGGHGGATAPAPPGGPTVRPGKSDDPKSGTS